ncbi:MAG TPA: phosphatase PAP2 family protein [Steroidobacteraceae bacterium]|nr:phosphatase PAP2 family protein [Steroidobacteraceae bacterium]
MRTRIGTSGVTIVRPALAIALAITFSLTLVAPTAHAQQASPPGSDARQQQSAESGEPASPIEYAPPRKGVAARTLEDAKNYFTAPLRWNGRDWEYFGGALAAIAVAHHYDTQARTHFDAGSSSPLGPKESGELTDALPAAALFLGTWGYASLIGSHTGEGEAWNMFESSGLSLVSAYALKYIVRRSGPDTTTDPNHWFGGGSSFPSEHTTLAFAVGTVLAESGNPEFRWIRRTIGYGVGIGTAYLRMRHNAHWLSDTVAGAALGMASAHFVMDRSAEREQEENSEISLVPVQGGVMLAYTAEFPN